MERPVGGGNLGVPESPTGQSGRGVNPGVREKNREMGKVTGKKSVKGTPGKCKSMTVVLITKFTGANSRKGACNTEQYDRMTSE